jgi:hypothetical protein
MQKNNSQTINADLSISVLEDVLRYNALQLALHNAGLEVEPTGFTHFVEVLFGIKSNVLDQVSAEVYTICFEHLDRCTQDNFDEEAKELYIDLLSYKKYCYNKLIESHA